MRRKFLNIEIDDLYLLEAIKEIDILINNGRYNYMVTPNVDHIVRIEEDEEFKRIYSNADLILTDGMPLVWISHLQNKPIKEKLSGSDIFPKICEHSMVNGYTIYLLGAAKGVAEVAAKNLEKKYPGLKIVGTYSPSYEFENNENEIDNIIEDINRCKPNILAVALGSPKQEKFIYQYKNKLKVPLSLAIGATIDFEAGNISRAPMWMQKSGLEWFYRFLKEPRRMFKRYFIQDMKIFYLAYKYRKKK